MASTDIDSFVTQREGEFWVNALIGAVIAVVLSFVPLSPILGGGVAGYLQGGTRHDGATVGGVSGLLAAVPVFAVLALLFGTIGFGALLEGSAGASVFFVGILLVGLLVTAVLAGGMGALGGYLGVWLAERGDDETPREAGPAEDEAGDFQRSAEPADIDTTVPR